MHIDIPKLAEKAVRKFTQSNRFRDLVWGVAMDRATVDHVPLSPIGFRYAIGAAIRAAGASVPYARDRGFEIYDEMLADEKIEFGDPDYAWDAPAARIIADEYELRFWEAV